MIFGISHSFRERLLFTLTGFGCNQKETAGCNAGGSVMRFARQP